MYFMPVSWVLLLWAHYWSRTRQGGGGLPWVQSVLWMSTVVMLISTVAFEVEDLWLGHEAVALGLNWPHTIQWGASVGFMLLIAVEGARVLGKLRRFDPALLGRWIVGGNRWQTYSTAHVLNLAIFLMLFSGIAVGIEAIWGSVPDSCGV